tara:strand:+ start:6993 stop:7541 length:549 start_codon:yes stop_codon:yes gene_type:complete
MSDKTLNEMILSAIEGADYQEDSVVDVESEKIASANERPAAPLTEDIEKIASALEFVANRGIESFVNVEKVAAESSKQPAASQSMSGSNAAYSGGYGSSEKKTHHPAVASNEAAQNFSSDSARNSQINPTLSQLLANANKESIHSKSTKKKGGKADHSDDDKKKMVKEALAAKIAQKMNQEA